jgi:tRNA threonylcarbamoyl adenosine modification protein YeaZ
VAELILGLDTSTVVTVGLSDGRRVLATATVEDRMAHVETLAGLVRDVLTQAGGSVQDLTQVVVGLGPGPFTGLRVGIVSAQIFAAVAGARLHGVCSLDVIAASHRAEQDFVVATDARRREVYWARYAADGSRLEGPAVSPPQDVPALGVVGPAADLYAPILLAAPGPRALSAETLVLAGPHLPDAGQQPLYLRRPDATEPGRRKPVLVHRATRR